MESSSQPNSLVHEPSQGLLLERIDNLKKCFDLVGVMNSSLKLEEVLERIMTTSRQALAAETCSLLLADEKKDELIFEVAQGPASGSLKRGFRLKKGQGIAGWVYQSGEAVLIPDAYQDSRFNPNVDKQTGYRTRSILCVPLTYKGRVIGVAQLINKHARDSFDEADLEMFSLLGAQAAVAIENARLHSELLLKQRLEFDMEIAASVQQEFVPKCAPQIAGLDVAGTCRFCDATGGDYFDFLALPGEAPRLGVVVGDVTGHGIPAALLMASARAFLRSKALTPGTTPSEVVTSANRLLCDDVGLTGRFMTLFYMVLEPESQSLTWVRAGHDPAVLFDPLSGDFEDLMGEGMPLGVEESLEYGQRRRESISPGSVIALGTDGIWEARSPEGEMFGKQRFKDLVRENALSCAKDIVCAVLRGMDEFRREQPQNDDVTLVVIKTLAVC